MYVVAVSSQKGGSGKTTLAGHLAVEADLKGFGPVALVDTDPQGSLAEWWNARVAETPLFARTSADRLAEDIGRLKALGVNLLVIDTPPAIAATITEVVRIADIVVVPARPSPHDLRAAGATVELIERYQKPLVFVINGAAPRARITSEAVMALSQHGTLAPTIIHNRTAFAASMIDGRTVMEIPGEARAASEIGMLWEYLSRRLKGEYRTLLNGDQPRAEPAPGAEAPPVAEQPAPVPEAKPAGDQSNPDFPSPIAAGLP
ncbi:MAG TPA: ParA family protein [Stellaceae bacterium]|nr:ParA family protein [Stellaceae bacterium]